MENNILKKEISDALFKLGYFYKTDLLRGLLFEDPNTNFSLMIDNDICNNKYPFSYSEYTKEQNELMYSHAKLYRFVVDDETDLKEMLNSLELIFNKNFEEDKIKVSGSNRELVEIDPTMPEAEFESAFIETYGRASLDKVRREFPVLDMNGQTKWIDYFIQTNRYDIAVEKNGETYHHPLIVKKEKYQSQLFKQNSLVAFDMKVYRWSHESMRFKDIFSEEMKRYFGEIESFKTAQKVLIPREFKLYDHQVDVLRKIDEDRANGKNSFLVVLPTGTGKTEILISDLINCLKMGFVGRSLILVPTRAIKAQVIEKINHRVKIDNINVFASSDSNAPILVQTYGWMCLHYRSYSSDEFSYLAIDEAHHSVAPTIRKVLQHFKTNTLIGFTATDKRLDSQNLEEIFGAYESKLSLQEAIQAGVLVPIRAFRIKSNIDLSEIRFNGKDYFANDLQRTVMVPSRDQLVVDVIKKYFGPDSGQKKQGVVFCVTVAHAEQMAKRLIDNGIIAKAVSGNDKKSECFIKDYLEGQIQFLTSCSLLSEGWDAPQTSVIVMARPTMSKVLYTQQLGRGTRKAKDKEALYVLDVVDNYGGLGAYKNSPWSLHALLGIGNYLPWADVLSLDKNVFSREEVELVGLFEEERAIEKINIFTFENEYGDYLGEEQLARELFVSTDTVKNWIKSKKILPSVEVPVGNRIIYYFKPESVDQIIVNLNLKKHSNETIFEDFFEFLNEGNYTYSYKMVMILNMLSVVDKNGECSLDELLKLYSSFYNSRINSGVSIDKDGCPYSLPDYINDESKMKQSILKNPFEKFERKRFMYQCKELNHISFSSVLWSKISKPDQLNKIKEIMINDLIKYYEPMGGLVSKSELLKLWDINESQLFKDVSKIISMPALIDRYKTYVPFIKLIATGGGFDLQQYLGNLNESESWAKVEDVALREGMFVMQIVGNSMSPLINDGDYCLFRPVGGSRNGLNVLVQLSDDLEPNQNAKYTVKTYSSEKANDEFGNFKHTKITLKAKNPEFEDIIIEDAPEDKFKVLGEFVKVIKF